MGAERSSRERALQMDLMEIIDTQMLHSVLQTAFPRHSELLRWPQSSCGGLWPHVLAAPPLWSPGLEGWGPRYGKAADNTRASPPSAPHCSPSSQENQRAAGVTSGTPIPLAQTPLAAINWSALFSASAPLCYAEFRDSLRCRGSGQRLSCPHCRLLRAEAQKGRVFERPQTDRR